MPMQDQQFQVKMVNCLWLTCTQVREAIIICLIQHFEADFLYLIQHFEADFL